MARRRRRLLLALALLTTGLVAGSAAGATRTYSSGPLAFALPDVGTVDVPLAVPDKGPVSYVEVAVRIDHSRDSDLTLSLVAPSGKAVVLSAKRGGHGRNYGAGPGCRRMTYFADGGSPLGSSKAPFVDELNPEQPLATLNGQEASGRWKLRLADDTPGAAGTLRCWQLRLSRNVVTTQTARARGTEARLSYRETNDFYRGVHLRIVRRGRTLFDAAPKRLYPCSACPGDGPVAGRRGGALAVRDLDRDGEPEVLANFYSGGAHCCFYTDVYRYLPRLRTYRPAVGFWGDLGVRVADLGRDGRVEFRTGDDRFAYVFTAFAASAFPLRILRFDHGRFVDVTRRFPQLVRRDAARQFALYESERRSKYPDVRGVLAAWLADEYLLGRGAAGWRVLLRAERRGEVDRAYLRKLRSFLRRTGYVRS